MAARKPQRCRDQAPAENGARAAPKRRAKLSEAAIAEMFRRFAAANPEPKSELEYNNPFTLLVAVVLSAQATDAGVNKATRALFEVADTPREDAARSARTSCASTSRRSASTATRRRT